MNIRCLFVACLALGPQSLKAEAGLGEAITPVAVVASSTQADSKAPNNLFNGSGLSESAGGVWVHNNNAFREKGVERGTMWSSGSVAGKVERTPTLSFDLGQAREVGSLRVWNYNEAGWTGT